MTYNILAYCIYSIITIYITLVVGHRFHKNGIHFILAFQPDQPMAHAINNVLLVLYYCLNIGYCITIIYFWEPINAFPVMMNSLGTHIGTIVVALAIMHYINLGWIYGYYRFSAQILKQ